MRVIFCVAFVVVLLFSVGAQATDPAKQQLQQPNLKGQGANTAQDNPGKTVSNQMSVDTVRQLLEMTCTDKILEAKKSIPDAAAQVKVGIDKINGSADLRKSNNDLRHTTVAAIQGLEKHERLKFKACLAVVAEKLKSTIGELSQALTSQEEDLSSGSKKPMPGQPKEAPPVGALNPPDGKGVAPKKRGKIPTVPQAPVIDVSMEDFKVGLAGLAVVKSDPLYTQWGALAIHSVFSTANNFFVSKLKGDGSIDGEVSEQLPSNNQGSSSSNNQQQQQVSSSEQQSSSQDGKKKFSKGEQQSSPKKTNQQASSNQLGQQSSSQGTGSGVEQQKKDKNTNSQVRRAT